MIKLWKGIEKEALLDSDEVMTLFVCSDEPISSEFLFAFLVQNKDIKAIYFGAGRHEFVAPSTKEWDKIFQYCLKEDIRITIEVSPMMLPIFAKLYNHEQITLIVAYYDAPKSLKSRLYFKTDDYSCTEIYIAGKSVNLDTLVDNRYEDDCLLFEKEN